MRQNIHAGNPGTHIPKSAMFLMRAEDRGMESDVDPTKGGQEGDEETEVADLQSQIADLVAQNGKEAVQACVDACASEETGEEEHLPA